MKKGEEFLPIENTYRTTLERVSDAIVALDTNWRYTYLNDAAIATHPKGREATLGKTIWEVHPELIGTIFEEKYRESMRTGKADSVESYYPPMDAWFSGKVYPDKNGLTIVYNDITAAKKAEEAILQMNEQLRNLSGHIQKIREEERTSIAREIHDDLGQQLTGIKFALSALKNKNAKEFQLKPIEESTYEMLAMVDMAIISVRRIAKKLRPGVLDDLGLEAAIEWQAKEFEERTKVKCRLNSKLNEQNFNKDINTAVFRIFQESLTNILRHSKATNVDVKLFIENDNLVLEIIDNGVGISDERKNNLSSLGLLGMHERATYLGGEFTIEKHKEAGTIVTVKIPIKS